MSSQSGQSGSGLPAWAQIVLGVFGGVVVIGAAAFSIRAAREPVRQAARFTATAEAQQTAAATAEAQQTLEAVRQTATAISLASLATKTPTPWPTPTSSPPPTQTELPAGRMFMVAISAADIRSGPGLNYPVIGRFSAGEQFVVTGRNQAGDWLQFQFYGQLGWVTGNLVKGNYNLSAAPVVQNIPAAPTSTLVPPTATALRVAADSNVNLHSGPGQAYPVIGQLRAGQESTIIARNASGDWWQVAWTGQGQAWVARTAVRALGAFYMIPVASDIPTPPPQPTGTHGPTTTPTLSPTAAPSPSNTPQSTATPTAPPPTATPASVGRAVITHPLAMKIKETDNVTLEIVTEPQVVKAGAIAPFSSGLITITARSTNGVRGIYESQISLHPVMLAELQATGFDISDDGKDDRREVAIGKPLGWVWNIVAKEVGEQTILVSIYGQSSFDDAARTELVKAVSLNVQVKDQTLREKIGAILTANVVTLLGTAGPLGVLVAILGVLATRKKQQLESLEKEKKALEEQQKELKQAATGQEARIAALEEEKKKLDVEIAELKKPRRR